MKTIETDYRDTPVETPVPGYVDNVDIGLEIHLLIKDVDTKETIVNQRG